MSKPQTNGIESCCDSEVSRRGFCDHVLKVGIAGVVTALVPNVLIARVLPPPNQNEWRACNKCKTLFYNGYRNKGRCPAGQRHVPNMGGQYILTYDSPGPGQRDWRFCNKCYALFFDGYPNKGVCPAGGSHFAQGYNFTLLHDTRVAGHRPDWRFCNKCEVLFYNADADKGVCAARGGHVAAGYNFVLRFRGNLEGDTDQHPG